MGKNDSKEHRTDSEHPIATLALDQGPAAAVTAAGVTIRSLQEQRQISTEPRAEPEDTAAHHQREQGG